jgi:uncharacterized protein
MESHFPLVATLLAGVTGASAQTGAPDIFIGSWMGDLKVGAVTLRMVFNITSSNGALSATMDSPDQGAKGIPVSHMEVKSGAILLEVKAARGSYSGRISADGKSIDGAWTQGGTSFSVLLKNLEGAFVLERPQEPKPPFPYSSVDVTFTNAKASVELAGTLTIPPGTGPFPAVVLVVGSGPHNRDEELMGHKPFLVMADHLSRNGIAVLRYDERGVAASSKGDFAAATTFDLADDAETAFSFLAALGEVDPRRVGIVGHSEGALIAAIAAARNPKVSFIILLAGPGLPGDQLLVAQGSAIARASGKDEKAVAWSAELNRKIYDIAKKQGNAPDLLAEARRVYSEAVDANTAMSQKDKDDAKADADKTGSLIFTPWFRTFLTLDPVAYLTKVQVPVLALNGTKDLQVPADADLSAIDAALRAAGNNRHRLVKLEGLNHLFQHAGTGLPDEYGKLTETFAPEALSVVRDWILAL